MAGSIEFTPPYQDGWQDNEEGATPITADILNNNYDAFLLLLNTWIGNIEEELVAVPDFQISSPSSGQVLKYNGSKWVNANESGGGGGSSVSWNQILQTGTKISTITIDGISYDVYAPTPPTKTSDLTNDSNFVADASYVHTDNNYTSTEKTKLSGLVAVEANPSGTASTDLTKIAIGGTNYNIPSGGSGSSTFAGLSDVDIDDTTLANGQVPVWNSTTEKWENGAGGGGTTVIANPTGTPTGELNSIQIGNDIYEIVGGGGSGFSKTTLYEMSGTTPESVITLSQSLENFDLIEVVSLYGHSDEEDYKNTTMFNAEELIDSIGTTRPKNWWIGNDTVYVWFYVTDVDEFTIHTQTGQTGLGIWYVYGYKFEGGGSSASWKDITGTLTAGQTEITLRDAFITENSTFEPFTDKFGVNPTNMEIDENGYSTKTFADGQIVVKENSNEKLLFFVGYTKGSSDITIDDPELLEYLSDISSSGYGKASISYNDSSATTQNGWIGFYKPYSSILIRSWSTNWGSTISGTFYAVMDLTIPATSNISSDAQQEPYYSPESLSAMGVKLTFPVQSENLNVKVRVS